VGKESRIPIQMFFQNLYIKSRTIKIIAKNWEFKAQIFFNLLLLKKKIGGTKYFITKAKSSL